MKRSEQAEQKKARGESAKRCLDTFYEAFMRRHNPANLVDEWLAIKPSERHSGKYDDLKAKLVLPRIEGAKDMTLMKRMIESWGEVTVRRLIEDFFGSAYLMHQVINSNQDVGALWFAAPKLLLRRGVPDDRTRGNLDAVRRAMGQ
jgi:hypothetical protein